MPKSGGARTLALVQSTLCERKCGVRKVRVCGVEGKKRGTGALCLPWVLSR